MLPNGNCQYNKQTTDDGVSQMHHSTHIKTAIIFIKKENKKCPYSRFISTFMLFTFFGHVIP